MLLFFLQIVPEILEPKTWPWPYWLVVAFGVLWVCKQLAEFVGSVGTLKNTGLGVWGWVKGVFTSSKIQAAKERQELKESVMSLADRFTTIETRTETIEQQNTAVLAEVKPNGGGSLNDRVTKMDEKLDIVSETVAAQAAWLHHEKETSEKPIFFLDSAGRMTFTNSAFRELMNAEESDLLDLKYLSRFESGDQKRIKQEIDFAIENRIPLDTIAYAKQDGPHYIPIRLQASPDISVNNSLKRFFGSAGVTEASEAMHLSKV